MNDLMNQTMLPPLPPVESIQAHISGDVSGQVAVGSYILQIGSVYGGVVNINLPEQKPRLKARPAPVSILPRRFSELLDRVEQVSAASTTLPTAQPVEFYAQSGSGKTALLRVLARHPLTGAFPDGVVYLSARGQEPADLLQSIFDALFEYDAPYKPSEGEIRFALQTKRALILLDDVDQSREVVEGLFDAAPECTFLLASPERKLWNNGLSLALPGLPLQDARSFLAQQLGRPLSEAESTSADDLCQALGGHPLSLIQAAALAHEQHLSLADLAKLAHEKEPDRKMAAFALTLLAPVEGRVAAAIGSLNGAPMNPQHLTAITGVEATEPVIAALKNRGLIQEVRSGYALTGSFAAVMNSQWNLGPWRSTLISYFRDWARQQLSDPRAILDEVDGILRLVEAAVNAGHWQDALRLVRAVEGALALSRQWGAWERVLQYGLRAAEGLGSLPAKAWVLHQLGTRSMGLGENEAARRLLVRALRLRQILGDQAGAAVTRHNLDLLIGPPGGPGDHSPKLSPRPPFSLYSLPISILSALLVTSGVLAAMIWLGPNLMVLWGPTAVSPAATLQPLIPSLPPLPLATGTITPTPTTAAPLVPVTGDQTPQPTVAPTELPSPTPTDTPVPPRACVPQASWPVYTVRSGDTLSSIGRATGATAVQLRQANCLPSSLIFAGQGLHVPRLPSIGSLQTSGQPDPVPEPEPEPPADPEPEPQQQVDPEPVVDPQPDPTTPPNLVVTSFKAGPASRISSGSTRTWPNSIVLSVSIGVGNTGDQPAGPFQVGVLVNETLITSPALKVDNLGPGQSTRIADRLIFPDTGVTGSLVTRAAVDVCEAQTPCAVVESNETDNQSSDQLVPLPNQTPTASITQPEGDIRIPYETSDNGVGYVNLVLAGSAIDPEDGTLPGDALTWTSDQAGDILSPARGGILKAVLQSPFCSETTHTITLTATDKNGAQGTGVRQIILYNPKGC